MMGSSIVGMGGGEPPVSLQQTQESRTMAQLMAMDGTSDKAKIEKGSKEFEAMLLSSWLQQAEQSFATVPGVDDSDDQDTSGRDQMLSLGVQSLAQALEAAGGIGIASMIAKAMTAQAQHAKPSTPAVESASEGPNSGGILKLRLNSRRPGADKTAATEKVSQ